MGGRVGDLSPEEEVCLRSIQQELADLYNSDPVFKEAVEGNFLEVVKSDATVLRFCRARKFNAEKAKHMFVECMKWRKNFGVEELEESRIDKAILDANILYFNKDLDMQGRPVAIIHVSNHDRRKFDQQELRKFAVYQMEQAVKRLPQGVEGFSLVFDIADFGTKNMDLNVVQFLATALEKYYPERLGYLVLYNAPWIFNGFWKLVKPLLDENVVSKVHFANGEEIFEFVSKDKLPKRLGGLLPDNEGAATRLSVYSEPQSHLRQTSYSDISMNDESVFHDTLSSSAVLEFQPSAVLMFPPLANKESRTVLRVSNNNFSAVAFKFKTTNPKVFTVSPNGGILQPDETIPIVVELSMGDESYNVAEQKDKLLAQSIVIVPVEDLNIHEYWKKVEAERPDEIIRKKIRCQFEDSHPKGNGLPIITVGSKSNLDVNAHGDTASVDSENIEEADPRAFNEEHEKTPTKKRGLLKRVAMKAVKTIQSTTSSSPGSNDHDAGDAEHRIPSHMRAMRSVSMLGISEKDKEKEREKEKKTSHHSRAHSLSQSFQGEKPPEKIPGLASDKLEKNERTEKLERVDKLENKGAEKAEKSVDKHNEKEAEKPSGEKPNPKRLSGLQSTKAGESIVDHLKEMLQKDSQSKTQEIEETTNHFIAIEKQLILIYEDLQKVKLHQEQPLKPAKQSWQQTVGQLAIIILLVAIAFAAGKAV